MQNPVTIDSAISYYEGEVVRIRKILIEWDAHRRTPIYESKQKSLAQAKLVLGALKCAKTHGYTGEE